ncbi:MAG: GTP-binding protein, partial [Acutalibacteraceae bacterium]
MKTYNAKDIRNIAIAGHGSRGKTTLAEAMLFLAGATDRMGRVADGNTVLDFDAEEKRRKTSVSTAIAPIEWKGCKINIIDTPGLFDFAGGMSEGIRAAECALIVTAAGSGYDVGAEKAYKAAKKRGIARMFAVTRCDGENADFYKTFDAIKAEHKSSVCPVIVPYMVDGKVKSYVNLAARKAYEYKDGKPTEVPMPEDSRIDEMLDILTETVATSDEELMEKFFEGEQFTRGEIAGALNKGVSEGNVYPVYACAGYTGDGVDMLLDEIAFSAPLASEHAGEGDVECDENGPLAAVCFKTVADPFVGKMSFMKIISGRIYSGCDCINASTGQPEKIGKLYSVCGKKQTEISEAFAGDIVAAAKIGASTCDTLCDPSRVIAAEKTVYPEPCYRMAVKAKSQGDESKISGGLAKLLEEDKTLSYEKDPFTSEMVLSGLGEQHLEIAAA